MKLVSLSTTWVLAHRAVLGAAAAPDTCDPSAIQICLDRFNIRYSECGDNDTYCKCTAVLRYGGSCYAACPQEAMTTFIKTVEDGLCATFDPHMYRRDADTGESHSGVNASLMKSWLGIDVLEDHDHAANHRGPKGRLISTKAEDINHGDFENNEKAEVQPRRRNYLQARGTQKAKSSGGYLKHNATGSFTPTERSTETAQATFTAGKDGAENVSSLEIKALTVTPDEPTTTNSLSPQEYQSRLEKQRYKANLRSIRSVKARQSSEEAARRALIESRLAQATMSEELAVAKDKVPTSETKSTPTGSRSEKKEHSSDSRSQASNVTPVYTAIAFAVAALAVAAVL